MQLQRHSNQTVLTFENSHQIGSGGEGAIYTVARDDRLAAKIYHKPTPEHEKKLLAMFRNPPEDPMLSQGHASIAWPVDLLHTTGEKSHVVGFLMPRVPDMFSVIDLFVPKSRLEKCPLFTYQYLHRAARNIAAAIAPLHSRGYVIGDINESNILVSPSALVSLVDTDSFQVRAPGGGVFRC
jgi:DNA-binding helix-hairpin-helix protein with protein kinase domain